MKFALISLVLLPFVAGCASHRAPIVSIREVDDYVFGGYRGAFDSPPHADGNPRRAIVISWSNRPEHFVFSHEASCCPFFELPSGAGASFQFFEGNDGWAELFNDWGRREANSSVQIVRDHPERECVHVRWTYFGVNIATGQRAYRAFEDFWAFPNGLVLRRQTYVSLMPGDHRGYAREPIELIGMCPAGQTWKDVLHTRAGSEERHALAALDPFSENRYDVYWTPKPDSLIESTRRREGCAWRDLDDAGGIALALPLRGGTPFCIFGDSSGFASRTTRLKEHSFPDTGGMDWGSSSWDHWPVGWINSQGHAVDAESLAKYPNHFSPAGMDLFALKNQDVERGVYYSLIGVARGNDFEAIRTIARMWLDNFDPTQVEANVSAMGLWRSFR